MKISVKNKISGLLSLLHFDNRFTLIFSRIFLRKYGLNIYRKGNLEILVDHNGGDENGTRMVLVSDMYKRHLVQVNNTRPLNVLDLGANGGGFFILLHLMNFNLKKIVGFEMNPYTFSRLFFNINHNLSVPMILKNQAVAGNRKSLKFPFTKGSTSDSVFKKSTEGNLFKINCITLEDIYHQHFFNDIIDICKIDVEGAEHEIFFKIPKMIHSLNYLIMEIHGGETRALNLVDKIRNENFTLINEKDIQDDVYFFKNITIDR